MYQKESLSRGRQFDAPLSWILVEGQLVNVKQNPEIGESRIQRRGNAPEDWDVVLKVDPKQIPTEGIATSIAIEDVLTGRSSQTTLVVRQQSSIRVNPLTVRLFKEDDSDSYSGTAILTIQQPKVDLESTTVLHNGSNGEKKRNPVVSARLVGKNVALTLKRLNDDHFRVALKVSDALVEEVRANDSDGIPQLRWSVSTTVGARQISSPIMFLD